MMARDEDALICDMAEYYHIYDLRALTVRQLSVLACGLPESARSKVAQSGSSLPPLMTILCGIFDQLSALRWMLSADAGKGAEPPPSILSAISGEAKPEKPKALKGYSSGAEFEAARRAILEGREEA